jgi:hypothetical protein
MLRHVPGLRGATLACLPLLLIVGSLSAASLMELAIDISAQLWLWIASCVLFFAISCVCYVWIYRYRRRARIEVAGTPSILRVTAPFLGAWSFPMQRLIGFQYYISKTARKRQREFFTALALGVLAVRVIILLSDRYIVLLIIPLVFIGYPILQHNKPALFYSGIILYAAKTNNLRSLVHAPILIHICADDATTQKLADIAKAIVERNTLQETPAAPRVNK